MTNLSYNQVSEYRAKAVRGLENLRPGIYRYVYAGSYSTPHYVDIFVADVEPDNGSYLYFELREGGLSGYGYRDYRIKNVGASWYSGGDLSLTRGSLTDAGIVPQKPGKTVSKVCDLGHSHDVVTEPKYNVNFMVPVTSIVV